MNAYWFAIGFLLGLIVMHELWRWLHRKEAKLIEDMQGYIDDLEDDLGLVLQQESGKP